MRVRFRVFMLLLDTSRPHCIAICHDGYAARDRGRRFELNRVGCRGFWHEGWGSRQDSIRLKLDGRASGNLCSARFGSVMFYSMPHCPVVVTVFCFPPLMLNPILVSVAT